MSTPEGGGRKYTLKRPPRARRGTIDYGAELNEQQLDVVMAGGGPLLVIAGAGSGKTRTVTYRLARLIEDGAAPESILLLTFTNRASREMLHRAGALIQSDVRRIWGGTFHHVGNLLLRSHGSLLGFGANFTILDREDASDLVGDCVRLAGVDPKEKHFPKGNVLESLLAFAADTDRTPATAVMDRAPYLADRLAEIEEVAAKYIERKKEIQAMDFSDLLTHTRTLLSDHEQVRALYQERFRHILVDEYQDTNKVQADIIDLLAGGHRNLTVVGDDAQSIYSFRGAHFENIITFPDRYTDARLFRLEANYRSTPPILALANASIAQNKRQFKKELATTRETGSLPALVPCREVLQQADFIAQRILELNDEGVPLSEIAVLYRAHYHSMEVQMELTRRGIPFEIRSGLRFFEQRHIKDVTAFVRLVASPMDELAWKRALKLLPRVGEATAARIWAVLSAQDDLLRFAANADSGFVPKPARESWEVFRRLIEALAGLDLRSDPDPGGEKGAPPISGMIDLILDRFYESYMEANFDNAPSRVEDIRQLSEFATQYESPETFLSDLALMGTVAAESAAPGEEGPEEAVVLSSIHQAKGLEWRVVFMVWLTDSHFPLQRALADPDGEEEERRLFYVGLTRTKDELHMCYPMLESDSRRMGVFSRLSRFVSELPEELYERWSLEEDAAPEQAWDDVPVIQEGRPGEELPSEGSSRAISRSASRPADPDEPDGLHYEYDDEF
ncbi:MAG: ATP-dependent helicase [Nitrospinaceae bacterium]|jgi:DNA helicase II / ATP-dependent DNA helicase PcrA|nr:ATP-dependent helicase [Nitrospinaceae bacterium]MBT4429467.1 ATP-dependent helicase [Nitrospinaceae bacterium]MBT5367890.1 ATP-dependent helicase [Nitrospinaceae bacterium]MBT7858540.1 ATP-dependent helicase [Nitrospinaceae bacterium]